jgi:hypothetical protein
MEEAVFLTLLIIPATLIAHYLLRMEKLHLRTVNALERIAISLEAKPLKLEDVVDLDQRL